MDWKLLIQTQFNKGKTLGDRNAEKWYLLYRSSICQIALLGALFGAVFGQWKFALGCYLFWHFHILITDNYWKIKTIEHYLEEKDKVKNEPVKP